MSTGSIITLKSGKAVYVEKHDRSMASRGTASDLPILFIHGYLMRCDSWHSLLPYFEEYTRILFDHEPYGKTPVSGEPITYPSLARDAHNILAHFGYTQAIVVGHSAGALYALQLAADFPGTVQKLILVTPMNVPPPSDAKFRMRLIRTMTFEQIKDFHVSFLGPEARTPAICALVTDPISEHPERRALSDEYFDCIMLFEFGGTGGAQTWVIRATEDAVITKEIAEEVARITNGELLEIDTGHYPMFEDSSGLAKVLSQVLA